MFFSLQIFYFLKKLCIFIGKAELQRRIDRFSTPRFIQGAGAVSGAARTRVGAEMECRHCRLKLGQVSLHWLLTPQIMLFFKKMPLFLMVKITFEQNDRCLVSFRYWHFSFFCHVIVENSGCQALLQMRTGLAGAASVLALELPTQ